MGSNDNCKINAAYVASWKKKNPKLQDIETDGHYLFYINNKLDISEIYMQDILKNPNIFYSIDTMTSELLYKIIKVHIHSILIKEKQLKEKVRRYNEYEYN